MRKILTKQLNKGIRNVILSDLSFTAISDKRGILIFVSENWLHFWFFYQSDLQIYATEAMKVIVSINTFQLSDITDVNFRNFKFTVVNRTYHFLREGYIDCHDKAFFVEKFKILNSFK